MTEMATKIVLIPLAFGAILSIAKAGEAENETQFDGAFLLLQDEAWLYAYQKLCDPPKEMRLVLNAASHIINAKVGELTPERTKFLTHVANEAYSFVLEDPNKACPVVKKRMRNAINAVTK